MRARVAALCLLLTGCAGSGAPKEPPTWSPTAACVSDVAQLPATPLRLDAGVLSFRAEFRDLAACVDSDAAPAPVVLFALEGALLPAEIDLSLSESGGLVMAAQVEVPDAQFRVLQRHSFRDFALRSGRFTRRLFLNAEDAGARYLLLRPDPEAQGRDLEHISGRRVATVWMAAGWMDSYADGREVRTRLALWDAGAIGLELRAAEAL